MLPKNCKWYTIVHRPRCPLINSIMIDGMTHFYRKDFPMDYSLKNFIYVDGYWYGDDLHENRKREEIEERLNRNHQFLLNMMESAYAEWKSFEEFCRGIRGVKFKYLNIQEIKENYDKITRFLLEWNGRFLQFMWLPERILERKIKTILQEKSPKDFPTNFLLLTSPSKEGFLEEENRKLLELVLKIKLDNNSANIFNQEIETIKKELQNHPELQNLILTHLEEFSWLANTSFDGSFRSIDSIIQRIKNTVSGDTKIRVEELERTKKEREGKIKELILRLKLSEQELSLLATTRELVYFRTFRTDIQWKMGYYAFPLFQEIALRMGISLEDFHYLTYFEVSYFLGGNSLDKNIIIKRRHRYAMIADVGKMDYYYDKRKIDEIKKQVETKEKLEIKELRGDMASPGVVRGKVKIIHSIKDLSKIKTGDILVTPMTKPDYILAMEKAAAFVTDEGGITCHAAIVAREMKKPCIISTKIATKVLKDGDLVEVDATNGTVKKL